MKNLFKRIGAAFLLCFVTFNVFAVDLSSAMNRIPGEAAGMYDPGNGYSGRLENASRDIKRLTRTTQGVAFVGIAVPEGEAVGQPVSLDYDAERADGDRLHAKIGATEVNSGLYDWEIVPLARWANSNYTSAVTFVGGATSNDDQTLIDIAKAAEEEDKRVFWISYHPDLVDTLVGYNLFMVDAMLTGSLNLINFNIMDLTDLTSILNPINTKIRDFADRSKNTTFPVIKGYNDYAYASDESTVAEFTRKILENQLDYDDWDSDTTYIYSDGEMPITYQVNGGKIGFTGYPIYHNMVHESNTWTLTLTRGKHVMVDQLKERKLNQKLNRMLLPQVTVTVKIPPSLNFLDDITLMQHDPLKYALLEHYFDMGYEIEDTKTKIEKNFEPIPELVDFMSMKENYEAMKMVSPVVFNSAERTCHWLAFFRSVKGDHENKTEEWVRFIEAVNARYPEGSANPVYSYQTPRLWVAD